MADEEKDLAFYKKPHSTSHMVLQELKDLWSLALPITAMNCSSILQQAVSILFLGRLGSLALAGGVLSIGFTKITGYSVLIGLSAGLEPVCSQAYGKRNYTLLTSSLRRMIAILLVATVPISLLWINLEPIMVYLGQDKELSSMAARYCLFSLPDLLTNAFLQPMNVYLRSQKVTRPLMWCSLAALCVHVPLNYVVVGVFKFGFVGVAVSSVITNANTAVLVAWYVHWSGRWRRRSSDIDGGGDGGEGEGGGYLQLMRLAVPSCVGVCLEWWWYELVTVLSGYLPNPQASVAATGILTQTSSLMYTVPWALAVCASSRVGNELGAGRPHKAKRASMVALLCGLMVGIFHVTWTFIIRHRWSHLFTPDPNVGALVAVALPLLGLSELGSCPQTVGCGILRGMARPVIRARVYLGSFYFVGTPVAMGLVFWARVGFSGFWIGLLAAQVSCVVCVLYVVFMRTDWEAEGLRAHKLAGTTVGDDDFGDDAAGVEMGKGDVVKGGNGNEDGENEERKELLGTVNLNTI